MTHTLYIGIHGYAGSGKDTVAKALRLMLSHSWKSFEEFRVRWECEAFTLNYATFGNGVQEDAVCYCIAFADQLKHICSEMFGIPVERFYNNKENAWVCITDDFRYTEKKPYGTIITAEEYNNMMNAPYWSSQESSGDKKWMSLREILVYVGTYVCQNYIHKHCFVNGVANKIRQIKTRNRNLKYVICTDVRFYHEQEFVKKNGGVNIDIVRAGVEQLDNKAEHEFDGDEEVFDYTLYNDGTYEELLRSLWDLVHDNEIFRNETVDLISRDGTNNYLRKIYEDDTLAKYACEFEYDTCRTCRDGGSIIMIDPSGGPYISLGAILPDAGKVSAITYDADLSKFVLEMMKDK